MKIGFYLAYGPNTQLNKEGLGRYLGSLINGFVSTGNEVSIACPEWLLPSIHELLKEFRVQDNSVRVIVATKKLALWRFYDLLKNKKKTKIRDKYKLFRRLCSWSDIVLSMFASITNMFVFCLLAFACLLVGIIALPFVLVFALLYFLVKWTRTWVQKRRYGIDAFKRDFNRFYKKFSESGQSIERRLHDQMLKNIEKKITQKINSSSRNSADVWFCPAAFWKSVSDIKGTVVLNVPDLVTGEFCSVWANYTDDIDADSNVKETILACKYHITYCEYLRKSLLIDRFGLCEPYSRAIPHSTNNLMPYICFDEQMAKKMNVQELDATTNYARSVLNNLWLKNNTVQSYLREFNFKDVHYIFYASQDRPYKNILMLIKAYEYILRRRYCNVKLVLTGDIVKNPTIWNYVTENRLQFDVLPFVSVSTQELAALYHCADLVVNPTLYEGGFPFTFGEGMSVGTPSLMSDIPQVHDAVEEYGLEETMLFDPYNWRALADKIEQALQNRDELYQKELPMYQDMVTRTKDVVAQEYIKAFEYFIEKDRADQRKVEAKA